jgi:hypothetical protein
MNSRRHNRLARVFLGALLLGFAGLGVAADGFMAPAAEAGVWTKHSYSFAYMGFTSTYSCDGLADKLRQLLLASGARADVKSNPGACASPYGRPDKLARAELTFYTLAPAASAPAGAEGAANGAWKPVVFGTGKPSWLQNGDCELVDQFQREVLPMFSTRNVDSRMTCIPHQESGSSIRLEFQSFTAQPGADATGPAAHAPSVFAYPAKGQTVAQQAADKAECAALAVKQSGYDPAAAGGDANQLAAYEMAVGSCLAARGYTVK